MSLSSTALPLQRKKGDTRESACDEAGSSNEELPPDQTSSELPYSCASHGCTSFDERGPSLGRKQSHALASEREADFFCRRILITFYLSLLVQYDPCSFLQSSEQRWPLQEWLLWRDTCSYACHRAGFPGDPSRHPKPWYLLKHPHRQPKQIQQPYPAHKTSARHLHPLLSEQARAQHNANYPTSSRAQNGIGHCQSTPTFAQVVHGRRYRSDTSLETLT